MKARSLGMDHMWKRRIVRTTTWVAILAAAAACGGGDNGLLPTEPDEAIEPFVGTWDAEAFKVTSDADTTIVADLLEIGGSFVLNVQPSGQYTAQLAFTATDSLGIQPFVEIGQMTVGEGGFLTLRPTTPPGDPVTSAFTFIREDYLRLVGPTEFDFNLDGEPDPAELFTELQRR